MATNSNEDSGVPHYLLALAEVIGVEVQLGVRVRQDYVSRVSQLIKVTRALVANGAISQKIGAEMAHGIRNLVLDIGRSRSTLYAKWFAAALKEQGVSFEDLISKGLKKLGMSPDAHLSSLTESQVEKLYRSIVDSAGRPNKWVNLIVHLRWAMGAVVLSALAINILQICRSEEKAKALVNAGTSTLGFYLGNTAVVGLIAKVVAPLVTNVPGSAMAMSTAWRGLASILVACSGVAGGIVVSLMFNSLTLALWPYLDEATSAANRTWKSVQTPEKVLRFLSMFDTGFFGVLEIRKIARALRLVTASDPNFVGDVIWSLRLAVLVVCDELAVEYLGQLREKNMELLGQKYVYLRLCIIQALNHGMTTKQEEELVERVVSWSKP